MKNKNIDLKQLALKIYFLDKSQRRHVSAGMDFLPVDVQKYIDEIDLKFPLLKRLSKNQCEMVFRDLSEQCVAKNGWELIREKMDLMKRDDSNYPNKLYAILFE
jgi:hypothetical protein